jgi:hypothetical protein
MRGINLGRVLAGGLIAGLCYNVINWIGHGLIFRPVSSESMAQLGVAQPSFAQSAQLWSIWILYGVLVAWLYASMRPRFGAGPGTAACAGLTVWLAGIVVPALPTAVLGLYSLGAVCADLVVGLVGLLAGAWIAGFLYRETVAVHG